MNKKLKSYATVVASYQKNSIVNFSELSSIVVLEKCLLLRFL